MSSFAVVAVLSLGVNAIQHVVLSIVRRSIVSGVVTSVFLVLPYCALVVRALYMNGYSLKVPGVCLVGAVIVMVGAVRSALSVSYTLFYRVHNEKDSKEG